jgi:hypothetical protein
LLRAFLVAVEEQCVHAHKQNSEADVAALTSRDIVAGLERRLERRQAITARVGEDIWREQKQIFETDPWLRERVHALKASVHDPEEFSLNTP